jgi:protein-arginine deiminase
VTLTVSNASGSNSLTRTDYITVTGASQPGTANIDVDTNRDGSITAADDTNEDVWNAAGGAVFYYNIDDDDSNTQEDCLDTTSTGADNLDLAPIIVRQFQNPPTGGSVTITVSTAAQGRIRIFRKSGSTWTSVYDAGASFTLPMNDVAAGDIELGIEGRQRISATWDGRVTLTMEVRDGSNALVSSDAVIMRMAPPIFATNLWEADEYHLVSITSTVYAPNTALRNAMQQICTAGGFTYREASGNSYSQDRWLQDSSEPAVVQLPSSSGPRRILDHVFQCARWRPVDMWCRNVLWGPDFDFFYRFTNNDNSHNYGGNLEVVPPTTGRPYGTVCYGGGTGFKIGTSTTVSNNMHSSYIQFFDACEIQGPSFAYTSEWLAVGHIDEFTMFIPAPNTARGWVCLIASPDRAYQVLQQAPSSAVVFQGRSSQTTVQNILNNSSLATLNQEVQARIDQARNQIKAATGITDADFIELPTLFENVGQNYMAAYNPGVVNLVCLPSANGVNYLAIPDPEGPNNASNQDMWQLDINAQLAPLQTGANPYSITYVDVFESYHELLGEAHCGSNTTRIPPNDDWWNK